MKKVILGLVACMMVSLSSVMFSSCKESEELATREYQYSLRLYDKGNLSEQEVAMLTNGLSQFSEKITTLAGTEQTTLNKMEDSSIIRFQQLMASNPQLEEFFKQRTFVVRISLTAHM